MTLKRIPKPRRRLDELPVAKLYLDDVREIVSIMCLTDSDSGASNPEVGYRVGDFECGSLEELERIGGSTRDFEITVLNQGRESTLSIGGIITFLRLSCPGHDYWYRQAKIREIFEANSIWWKQIAHDIVDRIPGWVGIVGFAFLAVATYFDPKPLRHNSIWPVLVLTTVSGYFFLVRGSVVRLRYAHASSPQKWFREHATQIAFLILSAVLGALATEMILPLKNWITHLWH
jgi:hypothetical protein